jgi:2,3-dihydroxy-p-cumate/2,3-dihydroxybenzoate 3,4-dioxygenase
VVTGIGREHDRVAIGLGARDFRRAYRARRTGAVVDHERLAECLAQPFPATGRAATSVEPPGGYGTTRRNRFCRPALRLHVQRDRCEQREDEPPHVAGECISFTIAPMIRLSDLRYVRMGTPDPAAAGRIRAQDSRPRARAARRQCDLPARRWPRPHARLLQGQIATDHATGWEISSASALESAAAELEAAKIAVHRGTRTESEQRYVADFIWFEDPSGNRHELVIGPNASAKPFAPARDCGVWSFSHIGLRTTNAARDETFWTTVMSARTSDRIGDAALLRIDEVHPQDRAFPSRHPGVQHVNHQVHGVDDVMRSYYIPARAGREDRDSVRDGTRLRAPCFLYFEGPDGMVYEYSTGVRLIKPERGSDARPRQFSVRARIILHVGLAAGYC